MEDTRHSLCYRIYTEVLFQFLLPYLVSQRSWKLPNSWKTLGFWSWLHPESAATETALQLIHNQPQPPAALSHTGMRLHSAGLEQSDARVLESMIKAKQEAAGWNSSNPVIRLQAEIRPADAGADWLLWWALVMLLLKSPAKAQHVQQLSRQCCTLAIIRGVIMTPPSPKYKQTRKQNKTHTEPLDVQEGREAA